MFSSKERFYKFSTATPAAKLILQSCFRRIHSWRVPPNWSPVDWFDEVAAIETAAACQAESDYVATEGIQLAPFLYNQVMSRVLTRYRQEWKYALRFVSESAWASIIGNGSDETDTGYGLSHRTGFNLPLAPDAISGQSTESLREALASLMKPRQWLITQLFWYGYTEAEIANRLGISQRAVSKRKQVILRLLREKLSTSKNQHK